MVRCYVGCRNWFTLSMPLNLTSAKTLWAIRLLLLMGYVMFYASLKRLLHSCSAFSFAQTKSELELIEKPSGQKRDAQLFQALQNPGLSKIANIASSTRKSSTKHFLPLLFFYIYSQSFSLESTRRHRIALNSHAPRSQIK